MPRIPLEPFVGKQVVQFVAGDRYIGFGLLEGFATTMAGQSGEQVS
jgi:hypothetical protein